MKIKAKGDSLPTGIAGVDWLLLKSLKAGEVCEVENIPKKLINYVEEVGANTAKPSKTKTNKKEV